MAFSMTEAKMKRKNENNDFNCPIKCLNTSGKIHPRLIYNMHPGNFSRKVQTILILSAIKKKKKK